MEERGQNPESTTKPVLGQRWAVGVQNKIGPVLLFLDPGAWRPLGWEAQETKRDSSGVKEIPGAALEAEDGERGRGKKSNHRALKDDLIQSS